ncbi:MAG: hypothetical protein HRT64_05555 [Erythrobacter sp.]|nr:hypothetical protein [Erythrobacter sp.]
MSEAQAALDKALDAFDPAIATQARDALAIGFASGEKQSSIAFSVTLYPRWVSLFFARGTELVDPAKLLVGQGSRIRHVVFKDGVTHEDDAVLGLVDQSIANLEPPLNPDAVGQLIMKSISPKKRLCRPQSQ